MSIEASMVMPLVLAVIVVLIYASFCLYNRCLGSQDAYIMCMREAQHKDRKNTRSAARVENMQSAQFASKYISVSSVGGSASIDGDQVFYEGRAIVGPGISLIHLVLPQSWWQMEFTAKSEVRDPAWHIRQIRRTAAVLSQALPDSEN